MLAARLAAWLASRAAMPFSWPANNCSHFVAGWIREATGREVSVPSPKDVKALLRFLQGGSLRGAVTSTLGHEPIPAAMAQTGDVVLVDSEPLLESGIGGALGICNGRDAVFIEPTGGVVFLGMERVACAWRL